MKNFKYLLSFILLMPLALVAQDNTESDVEEVVVVGSQIKGAKITDVLPVSIMTAEDVDVLTVVASMSGKSSCRVIWSHVRALFDSLTSSTSESTSRM